MTTHAPTPTASEYPGQKLPPSQQLAAAKHALLHEAKEERSHQSAATGSSQANAVIAVIQEKPIIFLGLSSLLGFLIVRRSIVARKLATMLGTKLAMAAIKRAITDK